MNIVITGASAGIGYETALHLLKNKENTVYAVSRDSVGLTSLENEFAASKSSGKLILCCGDAGENSFLNDVIKKIETESESLQIIINNAGTLKYSSFELLTESDWEEIYRVNVFLPIKIIRTMLPLIKKSEMISSSVFRGHIVNISSIGGITGSVKFKGLSAYSSSKSAITVLSECLAEEFREYDIAVNSLALGSVDTKMFRAAFPDFTAAMGAEKMGSYIAEFAMTGMQYFNGKVLPVSLSTP